MILLGLLATPEEEEEKEREAGSHVIYLLQVRHTDATNLSTHQIMPENSRSHKC